MVISRGTSDLVNWAWPAGSRAAVFGEVVHKDTTGDGKYDTEVLVRPREPAENDDAWRGSAIASLDKEIAQTQDLLEVRSDVTRPTSALAPLPSTPRPVASP